MFVTINHIPVAEGREQDFEELWRTRDRSIESLPGFVSLDILKPGMILTMSAEPPTKSVGSAVRTIPSFIESVRTADPTKLATLLG